MVVCLDDQMEVVVPYAELDDAKVSARSSCEGATYCRKDAPCAQAAERGDGPQRHVHGMRGAVQWPHAVRDARPAARPGFASGATAAATPRAERGEDELRMPLRHLD